MLYTYLHAYLHTCLHCIHAYTQIHLYVWPTYYIHILLHHSINMQNHNINMHACIYTYIDVHTHACMWHTYVHAFMYVCTCACIHACIHAYVHIDTVHAHIYVHHRYPHNTYIHSYTHTCKKSFLHT